MTSVTLVGGTRTSGHTGTGGYGDSQEDVAQKRNSFDRAVVGAGADRIGVRRWRRRRQQQWWWGLRRVREPTDEGTPVPGGEITYGLEAETASGWCLPEAQLAISGIQVARAIYDTLTAPDENGEIKPFLAESVTPNADNTVWTIKLRDGIKFSDGTALDATVVKNNLDAYRGTYPARQPLLFVFTFQDIASVDVVDPLTVTVTTKRPWVDFPWFLWGSARVGIMGQAQLDSTSCNDDLIGTGPFIKDSWTVNNSFVATKNPNYWAQGRRRQPVAVPRQDHLQAARGRTSPPELARGRRVPGDAHVELARRSRRSARRPTTAR